MDVCICITEYSRNYHNIVNQLYFNKTLKTKNYNAIQKVKINLTGEQAYIVCGTQQMLKLVLNDDISLLRLP